MRLPISRSMSIKNILHGVQGFLTFISWCLTIAVFTRKGETDGRTAWFFTLCFLTVPTLIYQVMVPMWSRARRFAHAYAYAALDVLFTIFWFSAWIAVTSYVVTGKGKGKDKKKEGCDNFKYGTPGKCKLSTGTIVLGVAIFLLFVGTSYFSVKAAMHFRQTGTMPSESNDPTFAAHTKAAFASNPNNEAFDADFDAEDDGHAPSGTADPSRRGRNTQDDEYALLHQNDERFDDPHPGRPVSYGQPDEGAGEYGGYNSGTYSTVTSGRPQMTTVDIGADTSYGEAYGAGTNSNGLESDPFRSNLDLSFDPGYGGSPPPRYQA